MSSATQSDKRVKSPVENIGSKSECEVSSSCKVNEFKSESNSNEGTKENTEITAVPTKHLPSHDTTNPKTIEAKMDLDSTNRNPLAESVASNNDSNRKGSISENKTTKPSVNVQNETNNNNNPKLRARASKKSTSPPRASACGWCSDSKPILKYILPTLSGENLQFCSEMCIGEFRKAVKKGACKQCGSVVRSSIAPNKEYCSLLCMNKAMPKNGNISNGDSGECWYLIRFCFCRNG